MKRFLLFAVVATLFFGGCDWNEMCWSGDCGSYGGECGNAGACVRPDCDPDWGCPVECTSNGNDNGPCVQPNPDWPNCENDWECFPEEQCVRGQCVWDEPNWCDSNEQCATNQVCSFQYECVDIVLDCPLTEECLADPEGYTPEWMGIDPLYAGTATGHGMTARVEMLVDFYSDHLYGEAGALVDTGDGFAEPFQLLVTGTRDGSQLEGQILEQDAWERRFDATFAAHLITSSEIVGTVSVTCDAGEFTFDLHMYRISPCGCDVPACTEDADCPADHQCVDQTCVPACTQECCVQADCIAGDDCVDGVCKTPCSVPCECGEGEDCINGYCTPI